MANAKKKSTPVRTDEAALCKKYKHIVPGSLRFSKANSKQMVTINTVGLDGKPDGNTRVVFTSDVFHVRHTKEVAKEIRLAKIRKNRQLKAKAAAKPAKVVKTAKAKIVKAKIVKATAAAATAAAATATAAAASRPVTTSATTGIPTV